MSLRIMTHISQSSQHEAEHASSLVPVSRCCVVLLPECPIRVLLLHALEARSGAT